MNDNFPPRRPPAAKLVPIVGEIRDDGRVTITHPDWRPAPTTTVTPLFPNDVREE